MISVQQMIRQVRPPLYAVAPLSYFICWGFAVSNIFIALGLWILEKPQVPIAITNFLSLRQWAAVFAAMGITGIAAIIMNQWQLARDVMLWGVVVKAIWMIALVLRSLVYPQTAIFAVLWLFLAYIQVMTYIFFIPRIRESGSE